MDGKMNFRYQIKEENKDVRLYDTLWVEKLIVYCGYNGIYMVAND